MSDPKLFTELVVYGAPRRQWRVTDRIGVSRTVEARVLPHGPWEAQRIEEVHAEITHGTEAGKWLARWA